ncbi:MAG: glutamine--fructose-6-phosphate transaminase (isomerizing) [Thermoprotei archaeon]|nr:MAG: glutamine--fructose-6-phosphate transaminase (isomerizing) [Thermoprotei archaeon]
MGACLSLLGVNIAPKILKMLKNLECRGYDSAGIAVINPNGSIDLRKDVGKIDELEKRLKFSEMIGYIGIGHTRWATHGAVTQWNAHPHIDCSGKIVVVHNGIIENYVDLKRDLERKGHKFRTQTDTEVIPHLIEEHLKEKETFLEAFEAAIRELKGAYALAIITSLEPERIYFARFFSPLVIGIGDKEYFVASDIPAFLEWTQRVIILHDGDYGYVSQDGVFLKNLFVGDFVKRDTMTVEWTKEMAEKGGFEHFMLKEIHEQPESVRRTIIMAEKQMVDMVSMLDDAEDIYIVAAGTSYYASLHGQYAFAKYGLKSRAIVSSEFLEEIGTFVDKDDVIIGVSQSGETADTLKALRHAKNRGAKIIAITNVIGSAITRIADKSIIMGAGPEIGVAATKTFTAQVATLNYMILKWAKAHGYDVGNLVEKLRNAPEDMSLVLKDNEDKAKKLAEEMYVKTNAYYLGRGLGLPTALEGALKMKEIAYIHAEGYPAGESKHGPIALVEPGFPIFAVVLKDETYHRMQIAIEEMKSRGGYIVSVAEMDDTHTQNMSDFSFFVPRGYSNILAPLVYVIPLQLVAYYTAVKRGYDPDKPRNLAKSVTVE